MCREVQIALQSFASVTVTHGIAGGIPQKSTCKLWKVKESRSVIKEFAKTKPVLALYSVCLSLFLVIRATVRIPELKHK